MAVKIQVSTPRKVMKDKAVYSQLLNLNLGERGTMLEALEHFTGDFDSDWLWEASHPSLCYLYDALTGEIYSWTLMFKPYPLGQYVIHTYTAETHRKQGYGALVVKRLLKKRSSLNVLPHDEASFKFYESVGRWASQNRKTLGNAGIYGIDSGEYLTKVPY